MTMRKKSKTNKESATPAIVETTIHMQSHEGDKPTGNNKVSKNESRVNDDGKDNESSKLPDQRPKLDDGFFEIEAIRQKRVRKGEVQYLIKWSGWPETANTWEPLWNLQQSCSLLIHAFEESLLSGKQRKRKGTCRDGISQLQSKKKQQSCSASAARGKSGQTSVSGNELTVVDHIASVPVVPSNGGNGNGEMTNSRQEERREDDGHSLKHDIFQKVNGENVPESPASNNNVTPEANGAKRISSAVGSKRRKPKGIMKNSASNEPDANGSAYGLQNQRGPVAPESVFPSRRNNDERNALLVTEILRPISFTTSVISNNQDVDVRFVARRSDGAEIMVTNKYLKDHDPLMLLNFYEKHLRYSPSIMQSRSQNKFS